MVLQWIAVASIIAFILYKSTKGIPAGAPPGPLRLPFIGNLHQLGSDPVMGLTKISKNFPEGIYSAQLGDYFAVVVNRHSLAVDLYKRNGVKTSGRFSTQVTNGSPHNFLTNLYQELFGSNDLVFSSYSERWKYLRKFTHSVLFVPTVLQKVSSVMQKEFDNLSAEWERSAKAGTLIEVSHDLCSMAMKIMFTVLFGRHMNPEDSARILPVLQDIFLYLGTGDPSDFLTVLQRIPSSNQKMKKTCQQFKDFVDNQIRMHEEDLGEPQDFTDYLLVGRNKEEHKSADFLTNEVIRGVLMDLIGGGTDSSAIATSWAILLSVHYSQVQERIHKEIDEVGSTDMSQLPYLQAVLKEVHRQRPVAPLSVPHTTEEDVTVGGYLIPKGTIVFHNIWGCNYIEKDWKNPYEFRPERFLEGEEKDNLCLVFGTGLRECIGSNFAKQLLNMIIPKIFAKFKFSSTKPLDLRPDYGLTYTPKAQNITVALRK